MYDRTKERKGEWLIEANTQSVLYFSIVATQHKTKARKARKGDRHVRRALIIGKARRRVLIIGKVRRRAI